MIVTEEINWYSRNGLHLCWLWRILSLGNCNHFHCCRSTLCLPLKVKHFLSNLLAINWFNYQAYLCSWSGWSSGCCCHSCWRWSAWYLRCSSLHGVRPDQHGEQWGSDDAGLECCRIWSNHCLECSLWSGNIWPSQGSRKWKLRINWPIFIIL